MTVVAGEGYPTPVAQLRHGREVILQESVASVAKSLGIYAASHGMVPAAIAGKALLHLDKMSPALQYMTTNWRVPMHLKVPRFL